MSSTRAIPSLKQLEQIHKLAAEQLGKSWDELTDAEKALVGRLVKRCVEVRAQSFGRDLTEAEKLTLDAQEKALVAIGSSLAMSDLERVARAVLEFAASQLPPLVKPMVSGLIG